MALSEEKIEKLKAAFRKQRRKKRGQPNGIEADPGVAASYYLNLIKITDKNNDAFKDIILKYKKRLDSGAVENATPEESLLSEIEKQMVSLETIAEKYAVDFASKGKKIAVDSFKRDINKAIGIDLSDILDEQAMNRVVKKRIKENIRLIKNLSDYQYKKIAKIVKGNFTGTSTESLVAKLQSMKDIDRSRALLIATDQNLKITADISAESAKSAGLTHFIWITKKDGKVRDEDYKKRNKRFTYADGDGGDFPGKKVRCRCRMKPDLGPLLKYAKPDKDKRGKK